MSSGYPMSIVVLLVSVLLLAAGRADGVVVHEFQFDFSNDGPHAIMMDSQPSFLFTDLPLPGGLSGTFAMQITPTGGNINQSTNAGIGVEGAPDGNRIGAGEFLDFQVFNVTDPRVTNLQFLDATFSDPSATTASNRLIGGESATFQTFDGQAGMIMGNDNDFNYPIPQPATGAAIRFGAAAGSNYQLNGFKLGFVDETTPTPDPRLLALTFGNDDVSSPGVEAVIFGMGNTGSTNLTQTVPIPDALGGGTFDLNVQTVGGNLNVDATGLGVQGAPEGARIAEGEFVELTFDNFDSPGGITGVRVIAMRSDAGAGTNALLAEGELAAFMAGGVMGVIEGTDERNVFLPLGPDGVVLLPGDTLAFTLDAMSSTNPTGAVGYRIAGLQIEFLTAGVPEPATGLLGLLGMAALGVRRRRRGEA